MNVADKSLCEELYKLSGWEPEYWKRNVVGVHDYLYAKMKVENSDPAYDLGYLLRELPDYTSVIKYEGDNYTADALQPRNYEHIFDTPEDALCKLAIELFKQGILK